MENTNTGYLLLCGCPLAIYLAGFVTALVAVKRVMQHGWWGLLPFGGTIKIYMDERQG